MIYRRVIPRLGGGDVGNGGGAPLPSASLRATRCTRRSKTFVGRGRTEPGKQLEAKEHTRTHTQAVFTIGKTHTLTNPTGTM